ncbi:MAG: hypothetical protein A2653_03000 [Candidatus Zambryskibacteria bacterium RIFCSPHIGHO2_01_FULL_43_25]|uniref:SCP domain-containing protein n=1 Tax=Candidatus Zambryskibacteria bacterium RIFCSPLOWO2_01_FULL_45_21 TaxID=1802761 RepID=A0A1G2U0F4_9BACT|nr:MAG: hypothetical protein A2653_03000 [Candidatus Zambryskibacteria bacterium RIFCSPHIGHO2_01_FULL_43_25]OHB00946.1 MAG: hypothetical protein A3E94_00200 [Candidatus Zambryskibacteria bacterium RIFCSPHIGHO2_12_FULL_44_12b]OHB02974.1 MAG: hypothetical protein A3B14_00845 [Candidatus Zambryskibacteria bacterium RIFCSPLOWO2_01_FULL_45_21]
MSRLLLLLSLLSLILGPLSVSAGITPQEIIEEINGRRLEYNLSVLSESPELAQAARVKAEELAGKGYLEHSKSQSGGTWPILERVNYPYSRAGENLAVHVFEAENVVAYWMMSSTHKANLLNEKFEDVGAYAASGIYSGKSSYYIVVYFGAPKSEDANVPAQSEKEQIAALSDKIKNLQVILVQMLSLLNTLLKLSL